MFKDLFASSTGALIAEFVTLPICSIKTNYQVYNQSIPDTAKHIFKTYGVKGFYNASISALFAQVVSTSSKYTFYNMVRDYRQTDKSDYKNNLVNGAISGIFSIIITNPFDVIKNHHQRNVHFLQELKKFGPPIFYRGIFESASKSLLISTILFPTYDLYGSFTDKKWVQAVSTTCTITLISQPLDYIKVRKIANKPIFMGFNILKYYKGLSLNLMRTIPNFTLTMLIIEKIKDQI
jgi:hypothetical protein